MPPKLTILCLAFNQAAFLSQTLEGFVSQKTNFPYEAIVADDCSTDGSAAIILEYARIYPRIIRPVLRERNLGIQKNLTETFSLAQSEYVALCEGDDYWTDPEKLQSQVNHLETHPGDALCFHYTTLQYEDGGRTGESSIYPAGLPHQPPLFLEDLLLGNFMHTASVVYRWRFRSEKLREALPPDILPLDWFLHLLHAERGSIGFIPRNMAVYRRHAGGCWWDENQGEFLRKNGPAQIRCYQAVRRHFGFHGETLDILLYCCLLSFTLAGDRERLRETCALYTEIYQKTLQREDAERRSPAFNAAVRKLLEKILDGLAARNKEEQMLSILELYARAYSGLNGLVEEDEAGRRHFFLLHRDLRRKIKTQRQDRTNGRTC
ncbi:MAG: glycosyltransferase [Desulfovibrionaceae bacterium]|nr:glycosyltransferase [Desulfovibrionaceae bacterium]